MARLECFDAAVRFARAEGIVPASESSHAIRAVFEAAEACKVEGTPRTILFNLSGHVHFYMQAYTEYVAGYLVDQPFDTAKMDATLAEVPEIAAD